MPIYMRHILMVNMQQNYYFFILRSKNCVHNYDYYGKL